VIVTALSHCATCGYMVARSGTIIAGQRRPGYEGTPYDNTNCGLQICRRYRDESYWSELNRSRRRQAERACYRC
jgi:hypothetical protein